jgi:hypothetical protein
MTGNNGNPTAVQFSQDLIYCVRELQYIGVDTTLLNQIASCVYRLAVLATGSQRALLDSPRPNCLQQEVKL